ncbi:MAG: 4Fe-4S binding protein [Pseudomonadota bacterium]
MKKIKKFLYMADIDRFRFYVQIACFFILIYGGYLALDFGSHLPTFACPFNKGAGGTCYLYPLQHQVNMPFRQMFGGRGIGFIAGLGTFILLLILFNKSWCGFICPLGTIQDWITRLRVRAGIRYSMYSKKTFKRLKKIKYILLILLVLLPLGMSNSIFGLPRLSHEWATPYCMICPGRTVLPLFSGDVTQLVVDFSSGTKMVLTTLGMVVTGLFFLGAFIKRRFFCLFCPMSSLQYLFSKIGLLRLTKDGTKCTRCGNCHRVCDIGISEIAENVDSKNIVQDDCMMCFKCVAVCPEENCLKVSFLGATLYAATEEGFFKRASKEKISGT